MPAGRGAGAGAQFSWVTVTDEVLMTTRSRAVPTQTVNFSRDLPLAQGVRFEV